MYSEKKKMNSKLILKPKKVIVDEDGLGAIPFMAEEQYGIIPEVVFVREDGWALGAPLKFEDVAYNMWKDKWVFYLREGDNQLKPISKY
jgi:hypothetical protein